MSTHAATQSVLVGVELVAHASHAVLAEHVPALPGVHLGAHLPVLKTQTSAPSQSSLLAQLDWHAGKKKRDATNANAKSERIRSMGGG